MHRTLFLGLGDLQAEHFDRVRNRGFCYHPDRVFPMQTTIELPESVYQKSAEVARKRGFTVEELIVDVLEREVASESGSPLAGQRVTFPLIHSKKPGTLDLSNFDFDDLLS